MSILNARNKFEKNFKTLSRLVHRIVVRHLETGFDHIDQRAGAMVLLFMSIYLTKKLDFTFEQAGFVLSSFGLGALLGTYIGGKLSDLIGFYYVMVLSLILSGVFFIILISIRSFEAMVLVVFLTSFLAEMYRPANYVAIRSYSKKENQTRSLALNRLAINLGFSVAPVLGGIGILLLRQKELR